MRRLAPLFFAAVGVLFVTPAQAAECWQVTGWATTAPPGWGKPQASAFERASLIPADCDVTPSGYRWLHIEAEYSAFNPVPADLYVLADHEDAVRASGDEFLRGLTWQGRYSGFPILWRDLRRASLWFELLAPTPVAPLDGAVVLLRQRDTERCVSNGDYESQSPHVWLTPGCYNGASLPNGGAYEIVDAGTNGLGEPLVQLEHVLYGTCAIVDEWYGPWMVLHDYCSLELSGYDMQLVPVSGGGYRIRSEDTGLCYGAPLSSGNDWLDSASCTSSASIYDVVTIQRAPTGGGGGGTLPPEDM